MVHGRTANYGSVLVKVHWRTAIYGRVLVTIHWRLLTDLAYL